MTKLLLSLMLLGAPLLAGCQSAAPTAAGAIAHVPATGALKAPRVLSEAQARRVMQVAGTGSTIWGVNYSQSFEKGYTKTLVGKRKIYNHYQNWNGSAGFAGSGTLAKAAFNKYVYQVPGNQVLILNQASGQGSILLNGFGYGVPQTNMYYMFGPGELVVLTFNPSQIKVTNSDDYGKWQQITYHGLAISGYTADPAMLGGLGALGAK